MGKGNVDIARFAWRRHSQDSGSDEFYLIIKKDIIPGRRILRNSGGISRFRCGIFMSETTITIVFCILFSV
jgi:hypothetical protein